MTITTEIEQDVALRVRVQLVWTGCSVAGRLCLPLETRVVAIWLYATISLRVTASDEYF